MSIPHLRGSKLIHTKRAQDLWSERLEKVKNDPANNTSSCYMAHKEQEKVFKRRDIQVQLIFQKYEKINCINYKIESSLLILAKALG